MQLTELRDALLKVTDKVYHYRAPDGTEAPYIVWAEDSEPDGIFSDNIHKLPITQGTIDYFTADEYDATIDDIRDELNKIRVPHRISSIQYEDDTRLIHYELVFEV